jgi:hypothetical protein
VINLIPSIDVTRSGWFTFLAALIIYPASSVVQAAVVPAADRLVKSFESGLPAYITPAYPVELPVYFSPPADRVVCIIGCFCLAVLEISSSPPIVHPPVHRTSGPPLHSTPHHRASCFPHSYASHSSRSLIGTPRSYACADESEPARQHHRHRGGKPHLTKRLNHISTLQFSHAYARATDRTCRGQSCEDRTCSCGTARVHPLIRPEKGRRLKDAFERLFRMGTAGGALPAAAAPCLRLSAGYSLATSATAPTSAPVVLVGPGGGGGVSDVDLF